MQDTPEPRHALREAGAFLVLFALATIAYTWPLLPRAGYAYLTWSAHPPDAWFQDPLTITWMLAWTPHALLTHPLRLLDANVLYPFPDTLRFCELLLGTTPITIPITLFTDNPVHVYNGVVLASYTLGATATALLLRELGATAEVARNVVWPVLGPPQGVDPDIWPVGEPKVHAPYYTHAND